MSLLNQMLKDLEQRNAGAAEVKPLSGNVRSVASPSRAARPVGLWAAIVLLSLIAAAFAIAWYKSVPRQTVQPVQLPAPPAQMSVQAPVQTPAQAAQPAPVAPENKLAENPSSKPQAEPVVEMAHQDAVVLDAEAKPAEEKRQSVIVPPKEKSVPKIAAVAPIKQISPQQRADNLYRQAVGLLQQGRVVEAQNLLEQSLSSNPSNHNARQLLAGLLLDNKRNGEAMALLQEGVKLAPEQTGFVMALARLQVEAGNVDAGLQTMQNGLQYAAEDGEYQGFYAALLQRAERHDEAATHYLAALHTDPANPSWLIGVGISWQALAKFADAREAFERARQVGKLSPELSRFVEQRLAQLARQTR